MFEMQTISLPSIFCLIAMLHLAPVRVGAAETNAAHQYILLNIRPGPGWNRGQPELVGREAFSEIKSAFPDVSGAGLRVGMGFIFSYFRAEQDEPLVAAVRRVLELSQETDIPVYLQLDGENWWESRPDLWNWWDPSLPVTIRPTGKTWNGPAGVRTMP